MGFFRELMRKIFIAFFRTVAVGVAIFVLAALVVFALKKPPEAEHKTEVAIAPTHTWTLEPFSKTAPTIVRLDITGEIGLPGLTAQDVKDKLVDTIDSDIKIEHVKAIIVNINTPGGTADDSDGIYRLLQEYKTRYKVPVYAFVDGWCASGGTMIACACDKIYATGTSLVGHVGVIVGPVFNVSTLMENIGVQAKTLTAGKDKDALNPFRPWKPGEDANFQAIVDFSYNQFITYVSKARPKLTKEVLIEQGAKLYTVDKALELGYIDEKIDSIDVLLEKISKELGIEKHYQVVTLERKTWFTDIFENKAPLLSGKMEHRIQIGNFPAAFSGKVLYLYCPEIVN
jgi:signal peptide peptidase SppA